MEYLILAVFLFTYVGMALGRVPGFRLDRTGIALLGAVALLGFGAVELDRARASVDLSTLLLLFALMLVSAQFQEAGLYQAVAQRMARSAGSAHRLLALTVGSAGLLSAVLANDIVVFAMAPVVIAGVCQRGLDPRPFLLGLAGGANAGSAMTIIGNPQNILIGQIGALSFWKFLMVCAVPALASLAVVFWTIRLTWGQHLTATPQPVQDPAPLTLPSKWQMGKGVAAIVFLLILFASGLPREIGALIVAAILLMSRRLASRDMIGAVDWHLLVLFASLFVVTDAFSGTSFAGRLVELAAESGWLPHRLGTMVPMMLTAGNTIGNVPATMLLLSIWPMADSGPLYGMALLSTLAGNFLLVGSVINIIVAERAEQSGIRLGFMDFARAGIPMTLASLTLAALWLGLGGWMDW